MNPKDSKSLGVNAVPLLCNSEIIFMPWCKTYRKGESTYCFQISGNTKYLHPYCSTGCSCISGDRATSLFGTSGPSWKYFIYILNTCKYKDVKAVFMVVLWNLEEIVFSNLSDVFSETALHSSQVWPFSVFRGHTLLENFELISVQ